MLSGCMYQVVDATDIAKAEYFCKDHKGVFDIVASFIGDERITCTDGEKEFSSNIKLPKE